LPREAFRKAAIIAILGLSVILISSIAIMAIEPELLMRDVLFEMTSAFGTVGLTTGITTQLSTASKCISMFVMFIGRLGPLTVASLWYFGRGERIRYPEGNLTVG
jgi:trk system potassium uptake protein TrkH